MTRKERMIRALERTEPDYVPTFEWEIDREVGKAITGSNEILDIVEKLDIDGIAIRPDYRKEFISENVYVDEWGSKRQITTESIAVVTENPIKDIRGHHSYSFPDPYAPGRFDTLQKAVARFGNTRSIILNVRDVFSDIRDLVGYENALIALISEQECFEQLLNRVIEYNRTLARIARDKFDVNIIATTDDIADSRGVIFGPKRFFDFLGPKFKEVIRGFKELGYYCIKHCDGYIMDVLEYWIDCGIDCIDPIDPTAGMNIEEVKQKYGSRVCIKGNINCVTSLVSGSEEDVRAEVRDCIQKAGYDGGYILSSSNTIHSGVKPENYVAMLDALRRYGKYPIERCA